MINRNGVSFVFERKNKNLKVACILDEFSFKSFGFECELLQITPENWEAELNGFEPDFLFIESAWGGKDDKWGGKLIKAYGETGEIAIYCAKKAIPIVFWNKEDPVSYNVFLDVARIADVVFTTASECVPKYKNDLGHDNVYFMHFAVQPKLIDNYRLERQDKFCFAGAYYKQFPERIKSFDSIYYALKKYRGVDIYDRFYNDKKRKFPKKYAEDVIGNLKYNEIYKAYNGYRYNINMNSITDSDSMFARRVFELMYAKTIVVSNYAKGLVNYFGDTVISTDDVKEMIERLEYINASEKNYLDFIENGYKRIIEKELYSHRIRQITEILYE